MEPALAFLVTASGLALSTYFPDPVQKMTVLSICTVVSSQSRRCSGHCRPHSSAAPPRRQHRLINSIGNLAGFAAPTLWAT
jgi:hypothetical protein